MRSEGIFVLPTGMPSDSLMSGAGATVALLFFPPNQFAQRLEAPATFPSNQQAIK
jgi:hypothetical protein